MHHHHHHHRRRKKRPNYGTRTVEVSRGFSGFGFTISGQQPCILSCIVTHSPADQAGLRAGDFLISVNGLNVSKLPHETVVDLIGNSVGTIRMQIAENYFSDSSDEEKNVNHINRVRPRYLHHKLKMNRLRNSPQKNRDHHIASSLCEQQILLRPVIEDPPSVAHNIIHSPNASTSKDISNVSAMVRKCNSSSSPLSVGIDLAGSSNASLEYRAIVGYLGTIEMPKQIATSSKLQTVRSCIRKMRQEKRNPTIVLMTILPNCLILRNSNSNILATYPSTRLNYVSSSSESENRFFGLVTSAIYTNIDDDPIPLDGNISTNSRDMIISNSCHVFVIDTKICDHSIHEPRANEFKITCTKDPISNLCLEFPNNSEYVVNLIRSMYTMKIFVPINRNIGFSDSRNNDIQNGNIQANSPQPSNHSEVTTTSSNSDSGIGFHNDCTNISDRIVVVDFPGLMNLNRTNNNLMNPRPHAICNSIDPVVNAELKSENIINKKPKSLDFNTRLTVRAMPDPKVTTRPFQKSDIPDLVSFSMRQQTNNLITTRSCDNVITSVEHSDRITKKQLQISMDDIIMLTGGGGTVADSIKNNDHVFLEPEKPVKKFKKQLSTNIKDDGFVGLKTDPKLMSYKLSPKVFGISRPNSMSFENLSRNLSKEQHKKQLKQEEVNHLTQFEVWGSLQELRNMNDFENHNDYILEGTYSEPDLMSRALPSATSPFRRWGQSSFRSPRSAEPRTLLARRPSSLAASENDVYAKSMDDFGDDLCSHHSQSGNIGQDHLLSIQQNHQHHHQQQQENNNNGGGGGGGGGVSAWGSSFEKLLEDPSGLHTFAEFLKKEFSAENIYFWTACERYRLIENETDRAEQAIEIFSKHLAIGASEPVNVDSQARNTAEDNLQTAEHNLFSQAQKQIFNLMKFDSYQRFIRSDLYKKCLEAESKNQPLPYPGDLLDELLRTNLTAPAQTKLKKSMSNAEDRRRKSLLPWHRKVRCKSRDRNDTDFNNINKSNGKSMISGNSMKTPTTNSTSDIHSSRSSLSSFDATAAIASGSDDPKACTLCRVILCDGATTIAQTRNYETVRQFMERLLEKRGIHYQFFDVILNGKPIDLENPATHLAGNEVHIEQRVAFKLDLPDPKVISVKSKPKKALGDVIRPILHKYNYRLEDVQIILRDSHEQLDMGLPVTVADGQRLQVVLLKPETGLQDHQQAKRPNYQPNYQNQTICTQLPKNPSAFPLKNNNNNNKNLNQQSTLDEITNKVFNELLQGKVESHSNQGITSQANDQISLKSEDCASETSSIFERLRRRDSNTPGLRALRQKKLQLPSKSSTAESEDGLSSSTQTTGNSDQNVHGIKKPLIAKWKTGVKLQVTGRTENHEEFLEGLKRAQRARLEDQRGTEINSELPDFLKDKENLNAAVSKFRKTQTNGGLITNQINTQRPSFGGGGGGGVAGVVGGNEPTSKIRTKFEIGTTPTILERPQPAPRLSINKFNGGTLNISPMKIDSTISQDSPTDRNGLNASISSSSSNDFEIDLMNSKGPPPLPPKPKILPIKPSNWGQTSASKTPSPLPSKIPIDVTRKLITPEQNGKNIYLDQPSSSFV